MRKVARHQTQVIQPHIETLYLYNFPLSIQFNKTAFRLIPGENTDKYIIETVMLKNLCALLRPEYIFGVWVECFKVGLGLGKKGTLEKQKKCKREDCFHIDEVFITINMKKKQLWITIPCPGNSAHRPLPRPVPAGAHIPPQCRPAGLPG